MIKDIKKKNMKWWGGVTSCMVLFGIIGSFAYMKMSFLINGVNIQATIKREGGSSMVEIEGNARNAVYLTLNGREIYINESGAYDEHLALLPGISVVTISAQDKTGRSTEKKFELMYVEKTGVFAYNEAKIIN